MRGNFKERGGQHSIVGQQDLLSFGQYVIVLLWVMLLRCPYLMSGYLFQLSALAAVLPGAALPGAVLPVCVARLYCLASQVAWLC